MPLTGLAGDVRTLGAGEFGFAVALLLIAGLGATAYGLRHAARARLIQDTPTSRVRSASQGYVELEGHARIMPGPPIVSPLTGQPCVWYRYKVEHREQDERGSSQWVVIREGVSESIFLLRDDTGECVIDPEGAHIYASYRRVWTGNTPAPVMSTAGAIHPAGLTWLATQKRDYRYSETLLLEDEHLYVIGAFRSLQDEAGQSLNEAVSALLAQWKRDPERMQRFDTNGDGRIDAEEWEAALLEARREALRQRVENVAHSSQTHVMTRPRDARPFIISSIPQKILARRYHNKAFAFLGLTLAAIGGLGWLINARFFTGA
ncbi:MAG: GIDE domain-containing protein [Halothiobacillaceae bacterium]|jgi:hypothetical protein|nr:GIDE domain-containing protein [Halothiobacillaceae bacterium]